MNIYEVITLLVAFWLMMMFTFVMAVYVVKDKTPEIINGIRNVIPKKEELNKVEIVTDEMEADMEEGAINEYYARF